MNIRESKQKLRKRIRSNLKDLSLEEIELQSEVVWEELYKLPVYQSASNIGLFLSMPKGEILTENPCIRALNDGKDVYVPRVGLDFEQCNMDLIKVPTTSKDDQVFYADWPKNRWGIPEAPRNVEYELATPGSLDLLIVPGLGFDENGGRLGQGKGYYDRFIRRMSKDQRPYLVAVGLTSSYIEEEIPTSAHDCKMDMIILPHKGTIIPATNN
jgi:5-formyltetrahydrofolate cyclo-ligase